MYQPPDSLKKHRVYAVDTNSACNKAVRNFETQAQFHS